MKKAKTRGQPGALAAVGAMVAGPTPHAVLIVGPRASGKTTLAEDLATGLFCQDPDPSARPCRSCRGCRLMESGNHPDLHRLVPEGPGGQIRIGSSTDPEPGTIRHLVSELALLPVEGGRRVAIVEQAHRINEDAQNALLKVLEEPPAGVTIVLCADDEECLLPTVRSRCVRVRLDTVVPREIERWLVDLGVSDAPTAARCARLAAGSPGLALAYARAPEAERLRGEIARGLLDLLPAGRHERLTSIRALTTTAVAFESALESGRNAGLSVASEGDDVAAVGSTKRRRKTAGPPESKPDETAPSESEGRAPASARRAAAMSLISIWTSLARDLAVAVRGGRRQLHEAELLDEILAVSATLPGDAMADFMARLAGASASIEDNVTPELALDVLALAWPRPMGAGAA